MGENRFIALMLVDRHFISGVFLGKDFYGYYQPKRQEDD